MEELHTYPSQYASSPNSKTAAAKRIQEIDGDLLSWTSRICDYSPGRRVETEVKEVEAEDNADNSVESGEVDEEES